MTEQERNRYKRIILDEMSNPYGINRNKGMHDRYLWDPKYVFPSAEEENLLKKHNVPLMVDAGIRKTIIDLNEAGFKTAGSCQGHSNKPDAEGFIQIMPNNKTLEETRTNIENIFHKNGISLVRVEIFNKDVPKHESYRFYIRSIPEKQKTNEIIYKLIARDAGISIPEAKGFMLESHRHNVKQDPEFKRLAEEQSKKHDEILNRRDAVMKAMAPKQMPKEEFEKFGKEIDDLYKTYNPSLKKVAPKGWDYFTNPNSIPNTISSEIQSRYGISSNEIQHAISVSDNVLANRIPHSYINNTIPKRIPIHNKVHKRKTTTSVAGIREKYNL